jgi:ubiquinone/menaquinone biosynthesis C-methylase UbiE
MENLNKHSILNAEKWNLRSKTYDEKSLRRFYFRLCQRRIISLLNLKDNQRLLDIGCGTGWALSYVSSLVNNRGEFYRVDISPKMIEIAKINSSESKNIHL